VQIFSDRGDHAFTPSHVCPLLRPPVAIPGDIPKRLQPPCDWTKQSSQVAIGEAVGKFIANEVKEIVENHPTIEVLHVFTHQGDHPSDECAAGLFVNRGRYYSALRKTASVDNYQTLIIPVDCKRGFISFEAEAIATMELLTTYPHIKMIDDLTARNSWSTVMANKALRIGGHTSATKLFVSLGFGLKASIKSGTIKINPHGKVNPVVYVETERKPHKPHKRHKGQKRHAVQNERQIATCADPASLFNKMNKMGKNRKAYYKASVEKFANILLSAQFPKKPLRKTHLRSQYFTELFGLTSPMQSTKATAVFELYLIKRPLVDPVISIFGK
jgi:hypothetical protein